MSFMWLMKFLSQSAHKSFKKIEISSKRRLSHSSTQAGFMTLELMNFILRSYFPDTEI